MLGGILINIEEPKEVLRRDLQEEKKYKLFSAKNKKTLLYGMFK